MMGEFSAGSAQKTVTPKEPAPLSGYSTTIRNPADRDGPRKMESTGVHDDITVNSIVITDGSETIAIASLDVLVIPRRLREDVVSRLADVDVDEVILMATHTHSGPHLQSRILDMVPFLHFDDKAIATSERIEQSIAESVSESIQIAVRRLQPARISVGSAPNSETPVNRLATQQSHLGVTEERTPTIDPTLQVVQISGDSGNIAVLVNYTCHPICVTANKNELSADYPGVVRRDVSDAAGGCPVLYLNGAAGDVNPRRIQERRDRDYEYMTEVGEEVGRTATKALEAAQPISIQGDLLNIKRDTIELPVKSLPPRNTLEQRYRTLTKEIERLQNVGDCDAAFSLKWDREYVEFDLNTQTNLGDVLSTSLSYTVIGGVIGILGIPGEPFVQHGLDFKERAGTESVLVAGYADDYCGYFPTADALDGYEAGMARVSETGIEALQHAAFELVTADKLD